MKKNLLLALVAILCCTASFAQHIGTPALSREAEAKCTDLTRIMANSLRLNEPEYIKLKALNRELILKTDEIKASATYDAATRSAKLKEIAVAYDKAVTAILTPNQLQAYEAYKEHQNATYMAVAGGEE